MFNINKKLGLGIIFVAVVCGSVAYGVERLNSPKEEVLAEEIPEDLESEEDNEVTDELATDAEGNLESISVIKGEVDSDPSDGDNNTESAEVKENTESSNTQKNQEPVENKDSSNQNQNSNINGAKENTESKQAEEKQVEVVAEPSTYTSAGLGISFDMPASWANKYTISDDGTKISVNFKGTRASGLLFVVTKDLTDYGSGDFLDTIAGINKITTINGTQYLIGGPTDVSFPPDDSEFNVYIDVKSQCYEVLASLR